MENKLLELLMKRRTVRVFKNEKPGKELLQNIINAGLLAPSSKNKKPVEFIVIENRDTLLKLKECKAKGNIGLNTAPCAVVVVGDNKSDVWIEDASIAASYLQLEAEDLGLGTCWMQIRKRFSELGDSEKEVKNLLNIPENYGVLCIMAIGYKNEIISCYDETDIDVSKVHYENF
ncbi:MAG: nitroreductase family protein [Sedimentibacter sp.]